MTRARTIAVLFPADMGSAVAALLRSSGQRVVTNLTGRSERTRALAAAAEVEDLGSDRRLAEEADLVLSILVPSAAPAVAERIAGAVREVGRPLLYVDCNAIAPATTQAAARAIEAAGGRFVDAGIIGPPPRPDSSRTRFYASGPLAAEFAALAPGLDVRDIGPRIGDASAVKMCYAAFTKGSAALMIQLLVTAERLGVSGPLRGELEASQARGLEAMRHWVPSSVPKSFRWVAEMEEIARTLAGAGIPDGAFEAAAATFESVAATELGRMRVEDWAAAGLGLDEVVTGLARAMGR